MKAVKSAEGLAQSCSLCTQAFKLFLACVDRLGFVAFLCHPIAKITRRCMDVLPCVGMGEVHALYGFAQVFLGLQKLAVCPWPKPLCLAHTFPHSAIE